MLANCSAQAPAEAYEHEASYAYPTTQDCPLKQAIAPLARQNPGQSGFNLLTTGKQAFLRRLQSIAAAEHTIDMQYYIINDDISGQLLLEETLRAADRGVRVRILTDDINIGKIDKTAGVLNTHKNIEVRAFNPRSTRNQGWLERLSHYFTDLDRITRRMHNKALIVDNQVAVVGGRNLGDEYFDESVEFNFNDLDVLAVGPVVAQISTSFDRYWNSDDTYSVRALHVPQPDQGDVIEKRQELKENREHALSLPEGDMLRSASLTQQLKQNAITLTWAEAHVAADDPSKVKQSAENATSKPAFVLEKLLENAHQEFIAICAYFVPREDGVEWFKQLMDRGIRVRVLTNSLASTDVAYVHAGYRRYREEMVESGVELYELQPIAGRARKGLRGSTSRASLHTKTYVIDRKHVVIGSFNLDPRSMELNTEMVLVIHSPEMAEKIAAMFEKSTSPQMSYKLVVKDAQGEQTSLRWKSVEKGEAKTYRSEPHAGIWSRVLVEFFSLLPIEDEL